jgi:putative transposase
VKKFDVLCWERLELGMARKPRVEFEGASYHVMARGNERARIFHGKEDYELFLQTLEQSLLPFGGCVHAWCLMPNHYHLAVSTPRANLSRWMAWLQTTFTSRYNRRHKRVGHLFQGRYRAQLLDTDAYARTLVLYIHLNPVRRKRRHEKIYVGGMKELSAYRWSSHHHYLSKHSKSPVSWDKSWLHYWGRNEAQAMRGYRGELRQLLKTAVRDWHELVEQGLVAGGSELLEKALGLLKQKPDALSRWWQEKSCTPARHAQLERALKEEKNLRLQLWVRRRLLGEKASQLAKEYRYKDGSGVSHAMKSIELKAKNDPTLYQDMKKYEKISRFMD